MTEKKKGLTKILKGASFYKRFTIIPGFLYGSISKQGFSIGIGPKGSVVNVPLVNLYTNRKPKFRFERSLMGIRLRYWRNINTIVNDVKDLMLPYGNSSGTLDECLELMDNASSSHDISNIVEKYTKVINTYKSKAFDIFIKEYAEASLGLGYIDGLSTKKANYQLSDIESQLSYTTTETNPVAKKRFFENQYNNWFEIGKTCGSKDDIEKFMEYVKEIRKK